MSVAFCNNCAREQAEPEFACDYLFVRVANGDLNNLVECAREMKTWADGRYMSLSEYVKRITPEDVKRELDEYQTAMDRPLQDN